MTWLVLAFGVFIAAIGVVGLARPRDLIQFVDTFWKSQASLYWAVGLRLALGGVLIAAASDCRFPGAIRALGYISLLSGVAAAVMGLRRIQSIVDWWTQRPTPFIRGWAVAAAAFGGFLVFAAA